MSRSTADLLRVLSIIAVLVIHATGAGERNFLARHDYASDDFLAVLLNQLARFSVPIFIMLSGYGLTRKYASVTSVPMTFFRERALKIALPYLFWSLVILSIQGLIWKPFMVVRALRYGSADYHFYFFVIILQCYVLFPLLFQVVRRRFAPVLWFGLLIMHLLLTSPSQYLFAYVNLPMPWWNNSFFIYWILFFYSGMLLGMRGEIQDSKISGRGFRAFLIVAAGAIFAAMIFEYVYRSFHNSTPGHYNHFNRHTVVLFSFCVWGLFAAFDSRIQARLQASPRVGALVPTAAALSFTVYIFHTWILRGLEFTFVAYEVVFLILVLTTMSFALAWVGHRFLPEGGWAASTTRTLLGLPPRR